MASFDFGSMFSNPKFKRFAGESLQDLGYGLSTGTNFGNALGAATQRMGQMQPYRDQQYALEEQKAKDEEMRQRYAQTLAEWGGEYADLAEGVLAGGLDPAEAYFTAWERRYTPKPGPDPFTLGAGQVRYDGAGNIIATGPEQSPETIINNNMGATDEFYGQLDKNLATQTGDLINAGMNAQSNNIRLGELEKLLQTAPQGAQGTFVQMAGALGLPVDGVDDVQAAQALINQMVPGQRPPGSGTMSDADLALFKASLPQIMNQPGGNQKILSTMKAINEYTIAQAEIAQAVANRQITPAEGRALAAQVPNPLAGMNAPIDVPTLPAGVTIREIR